MVGASTSWRLIGGAAVVALAASCVPAKKLAAPVVSIDIGAPAPVTDPAAANDPAVSAAASLLRRLELDVAPPDLPPFIGQERGLPTLPSFLSSARSPDDAARAADCLTTAIYYEARSEPVDGQRAVAQVVLNRVRDRAFPGSVCGVVWQGSNRATGCQFSFTCDGSLDRPRDPIAWARARVVALGMLAGESYAPVGSATHYHTTAISPWWAPSLRRIGTIGSHIFYRWAAPLERALAFRQAYAGVEPGGARPPSLLAADLADTAPGAGEPLGAATSAAVLENGVTVHRDTGAKATAPVAVADDVQPTPAGLHGVRVHRGTPPTIAPQNTAARGAEG